MAANPEAQPMDEEAVFLEALQKPTPQERAAFLDAACAGKPDLRRGVELLLKAIDKAGSFLESPVPAPVATVNDPITEQPGTVVAGRYKLLEAIGQGGMGAVWVAEQSQPVRRKVALKLIKPGMDSKSVLARFEAERQALAVMDHPNIAKVLDGGLTETGRPFFVMEYVKGVPITEYCDAKRLNIPERLQLFVQVCQAVQHAHQKGIIHRDLKPSNILVAPYDDRPVPKVIDFGLAKAMYESLTEQTLHTAHGTVLGTPLYMSPEQAQLNNLDVDTRSDLYSLGVLLYELLTGTTPLEKQRFKEAAWDEVRRIIREEEPPRPSTRLSSSKMLASLAAGRQTEPVRLMKLVRGELDWIVMKALEKDRNRRYETANGLARDVQRYLADEPVEACPPSASYRLKKMLRRNKGPVLATVLILLALLAGMAGTTWGLIQARAQRDRAEAKQAEADRQKARAEAGEKLASQRLVQVDAEEQEAEKERQIAQAVGGFLQDKLLGQADAWNQANTLLQAGGLAPEAKENPTIRELLDRAAKELAPEKIDASFPNQPLVQAEILQTVGRTYLGVGEFGRAIGFLQRSLAIRRQHLGREDTSTLASMHDLGRAYKDAGKLDLALPLLEETLNLTKAKLGPDDPRTLSSMGSLGLAYLAAGKKAQALPLFEEALKLTEAKFGSKHPGTLGSMNNLAVAYEDAGKLDLALPLFVETLKLNQTILGPGHPDTLINMFNLAFTYRSAVKLDLALSLFKETLQLMKAKLGPEHPRTLFCMRSLADTYRDFAKLDQALPLYEKTLNLMKVKLGHDHPETLISMYDLASAYQADGKLDLALPLFEETYKLTEAKRGPDHPDTLGSRNNLTLAYQAAGKLDLALPLFKETLKITEGKHGRDHHDTIACMNNLGVAYLTAGKLDLALPLLEDTVNLRRAKLGLEHPDTLTSMSNLAGTYQELGKRDLALAMLEEAYRAEKKYPTPNVIGAQLLDGYVRAGKNEQAAALAKELLAAARAQLPKESPQLAGQLAAIIMPLLKAKAFAEVEPLVRECLDIRAKTEPEDWRTFNTKSMLGGALLGQMKYAEAEPLLLAGYEGMKQREAKIPVQFKVRLTEALARLVQLDEALEKKDEAARWRKELEAAKAKPPEKPRQVNADQVNHNTWGCYSYTILGK